MLKRSHPDSEEPDPTHPISMQNATATVNTSSITNSNVNNNNNNNNNTNISPSTASSTPALPSMNQTIQQEQKIRRIVDDSSPTPSFPSLSSLASDRVSNPHHAPPLLPSMNPTPSSSSTSHMVEKDMVSAQSMARPILGGTGNLPNMPGSAPGQPFILPPPSSSQFSLPPLQTTAPAQQIPPSLVHPQMSFSSMSPVASRSIPPLNTSMPQQGPPAPIAPQIPLSQISPTSLPSMPAATPIPPQQVASNVTPAGTAAAQRGAGGATAAAAAAAVSGSVKFENALDFLDQVKLQFANQPKVYNQFLDIMKDFKAQCIDTPGVIARVSELFKGHKNLILGFNTFLPPGYKIEYVPDDIPKEQIQLQQPTGAGPSGPVPVAGNQRKQPEFDHARNYVKKIKMRFALQPQIYKAFLEILHTYHKEQHTIKDVYEQVANLFQNHQDLLEEFSQFLPDPVASQSAPVAVARQPPAVPVPKAQAKRGGKVKVEKEKVERPAPTTRRKEKIAISPPLEERAPSATQEELSFFNSIKQRLNNQQMYYELLKCISLFNQHVINKVELVLLAKDLLSKHKDLWDKLKQMIGFDDSSLEIIERQQEEKQPPMPLEIDFKTCKRYGPSYRALPKNYPRPTCSGRTELCATVLNDTWVSVPTGSEDFGFKNSRKNQYEEMLFKCEDDRFELDLVIELNSATIRALERILKSISEMTEEDSARFKLDTNLDILHIRSIERIYGDKSSDVLEALYNSPSVTIPVILKRLKQKDQEWTKARREWNKIWREVNEKNHYKALDHQSFFFKQNDKKNLSPKVLMAEIKQKYQEALKFREQQLRKQTQQPDGTVKEGPQAPADSLTENSEKKEQTVRETEEPKDKMEIEGADKKPDTVETERPPYHLSFSFTDPQVFQVIFSLVTSYADKNLPRSDKEKIDTFIKHFLKVFYFLENLEALDAEGSETSKGHPMEEVSAKPWVNGNKISQLFFGNNTFYVMFRLLQIMYDRLAKAKEFAADTVVNSQFVFLLNPNREKKLADEKDRFHAFLKGLNSFMFGTTEQSVFEEDCRSLFGVQSYILFTLDKVVAQLAKQLQALLSDETCSKLLALYSYECSRPSGCTESVYYSNCVELLEDERCFKFEYEKTPQFGHFTLQLLDSQTNPPKFVEFSVDKHEKWSQYVEHFIGSEETNLDLKKHKVYLQRTTKKLKNKEARIDRMDIFNGLECRICLSTYRLFYVSQTEDYMYKKGELARGKKWTDKSTAPQKKQRLLHIVEKLPVQKKK